ncbi:hypothetical protein Q1695_000677 [Nippostrongylus brasiliensis]|nr:hypothetical protein Q1695_000677 [Nippostrongylus brasiliensis]
MLLKHSSLRLGFVSLSLLKKPKRISSLTALLVGTCSCIPDSVGTSFIFGFIRDAQPTSQTQTLSATVLNGNTGSCVFTLAYRDDYDETKNPLKYSTTTVPSMSSAEVSIPSWYGWQYDSPGMQVESGPHQLLTANSTCPVTVIANNYDSTTGQGDSFLVLPTTWAKAGPVFAFTLPPSNNDATNPGYQHISIIPTVKDVSGTLTVMGSSSLPFKAKFGDQPTSYFAKKTPQNEPHTYHVQADGPILLVAGVTCAGNYQHCDHASYMPQPLPTSACTDKPSLYDDHAAYTRITNGYYIDVPSTCSTNQNVTVYGNRATTWQNTPVSVTQQMPLRVFGPSFGEAITIHAETAPVHVTRYYDQSKNNKQGAFIDIVASISQFITGNSTFYTRNENDMIEVVCDINVCPFATIDGTLLMAHDKNFTNTGPIMGINYYTFSVIVPKKGFHYFGSSNTGLYSYYVIGQATNAAYGYIGPINRNHDKADHDDSTNDNDNDHDNYNDNNSYNDDNNSSYYSHNETPDNHDDSYSSSNHYNTFKATTNETVTCNNTVAKNHNNATDRTSAEYNRYNTCSGNNSCQKLHCSPSKPDHTFDYSVSRNDICVDNNAINIDANRFRSLQ